jgi:hypothetical protein
MTVSVTSSRSPLLPRIATFGQNKPHRNDWLKIKLNVFEFKSNFFELASASWQGFGEGEWGRKRNMVPITSLLNTTYHRLPLVSSIHTTLERSLTSIASLRIPFPPKPYFQHKHHRPTRVSVIRLW